MKRFLTSILASAFLLTAASGFAAAGTSSKTMTSTHMKHSCPKGETWVHSYVRNGKKVKGYCRKG